MTATVVYCILTQKSSTPGSRWQTASRGPSATATPFVFQALRKFCLPQDVMSLLFARGRNLHKCQTTDGDGPCGRMYVVNAGRH